MKIVKLKASTKHSKIEFISKYPNIYNIALNPQSGIYFYLCHGKKYNDHWYIERFDIVYGD